MIKMCMILNKPYYHDPRVRRYAESLAERGTQVDVLCLRDQNQSFTGGNGAVRVFALAGLRGHSRGAWGYLVEYGASFILFTGWLFALYIKNRYQVIHVHNMPDFLVFTALIPRILGAKVILDIHDPMPEFYMSKYQEQTDTLTVRLMRWQEKLSAWLAQAVITANPNFKNKLVKRGIRSDKITVVNNVPDLRLFVRRTDSRKPLHKGKPFTLTYPGTIAPRYGLDVAIRSMPLLMKKIPELRLVIIGSGAKQAYVAELAKLAEHLGVSSSVYFEPVVPTVQVPRYLLQADVGIYPALPDPHMNIAVPGKVLEYAIMGLPIVASRLEALENLFPDSAILFFEPGNVDQFASCVLELYENPAKRDELVRNADRAFVQKYTWRTEREVYFKLLNQLVTPGARKDRGIEKNENPVKKPTESK